MSLYDLLYRKIFRFNTLLPDEKDAIIKEVESSPNDYLFGRAVEEIIQYVDKDKAKSLFVQISKKHKFANSRSRSFIKACEFVRTLDPLFVRNILVGKDSCLEAKKMILSYSDINVEEEEQGLRALATSKFLPCFVSDAKYQPRIEALKLLPAVMRLNCLEALTSKRYNFYNIFGKITDEDEFKNLLFSSVIKYRDKAEGIWNKYREMVEIGSPGSIKISGVCSDCGEFELVINSFIIKNKESLRKTRVGYHLGDGSNRCPFCGSLLSSVSFVEQEWKR